MGSVMFLPILGERERVSFLFSSLTSTRSNAYLKLKMLDNFMKLEPNHGTLGYTMESCSRGFNFIAGMILHEHYQPLNNTPFMIYF